MAMLQELVTSARTLRAGLKLDARERLNGDLYSAGRALDVAREQSDAIRKLAGVQLRLHSGQAPRIGGVMRTTPAFELSLQVPAAQLAALRARIEKEILQLEKNVASSRRQLSDETFLSRAPDHVVASIRAKLAEYDSQLAKSRQAAASLG
jgi:valyl-tRNA synthetase